MIVRDCLLKIIWALTLSLVPLSTSSPRCISNFFSLELLRQMDFIFIYNGSSIASCSDEITVYRSFTLEFISDSPNGFLADTVLVISAEEIEIVDVIEKICKDTLKLQGRIYWIILLPKLSSTIHTDLIMVLQSHSCLNPITFFVIESDWFENSDTDMESVVTLRMYHVLSIWQLHKASLPLPLTSEYLSSLVEVPGNFQNVSMKAVGVPLDGLNEFLLQSRNLNGSFKFTGGFELEVIRYLGQALNFSIEHIRGNGWIGRGKNGSLTGIGAQVLSGEADISMTSCEYHPYRQEKISYLQPTYSSSIYAYIVSKPASALRDIFFNCFEVRIWLSLVSFWILSSLLTKSFARLKRSAEKVSRNDEDIGKDAILFVTGAACQQGWYISPDSISMRLIVLSSFITHMVFYAAFTAMLVSLLSIDQKLIRDSSDLTKYQFKMYSDEIVLSAGYFVHKLEGKPTNDATQLADRNIPVQEGFLKIYSERSGIISIPDFFYSTLRSYLQTIFSTGNKETQIQEKICKDIQQVYITRVPLRAGLVLPKNSPLKPYLDQKVVLLMESGVRHRFSTAFFRNSVVQCGRAVVEKETIGIKNVWTAMLILISGFLASGCFVFAETILFRLFARNVML